MLHLATSLSLLSLVLGIFLTLSIWYRTIYYQETSDSVKANMHWTIAACEVLQVLLVTWSASTPSSSQAATVRYSRVIASLGSSSST